jgi:hypothetical protein
MRGNPPEMQVRVAPACDRPASHSRPPSSGRWARSGAGAARHRRGPGMAEGGGHRASTAPRVAPGPISHRGENEPEQQVERTAAGTGAKGPERHGIPDFAWRTHTGSPAPAARTVVDRTPGAKSTPDPEPPGVVTSSIVCRPEPVPRTRCLARSTSTASSDPTRRSGASASTTKPSGVSFTISRRSPAGRLTHLYTVQFWLSEDLLQAARARVGSASSRAGRIVEAGVRNCHVATPRSSSQLRYWVR